MDQKVLKAVVKMRVNTCKQNPIKAKRKGEGEKGHDLCRVNHEH